MSEVNLAKGRIEIEYRVICGYCGYWEYMDGGNKRAMKRWIKSLGWIELGAKGWTCPGCVKTLIEKQQQLEQMQQEQDEKENSTS